MMTLTQTKPTMLVVDDDKSILRVFSRILERNGYTVSTAETGKEAKEKLGKQEYDAMLVDLRLPDMNGTDLLPNTKKKDPAMVKIILTGQSSDEYICEAAEKGADVFLEKPVQPELLLNVLELKLKEKKR